MSAGLVMTVLMSLSLVGLTVLAGLTLASTSMNITLQIYILLSYIIMLLSFIYFTSFHQPSRSQKALFEIKQRSHLEKTFYMFFLIIGSYGIYKNLYGLTINEYLSSVMQFDNDLRVNFEKSSSDTGVSGVFKSAAFFVNGVFIATFASITHRKFSNLWLILISLMMLCKTLVFLDRASLIVMGIVYLTYRQNKMKIGVRTAFSAVIVFILLEFATSLRSETSILTQAAEYMNLGVVNAALAIDQPFCLDFGIHTLLAPLNFLMFKLSNVYFIKDCALVDYIENPATNIVGNLHQDFYMFSFLFYVVYAYFLSFCAKRSPTSPIFYILSVQFLMNTIMFIGVPPFRGIEFYITICCAILLVKIQKPVLKVIN